MRIHYEYNIFILLDGLSYIQASDSVSPMTRYRAHRRCHEAIAVMLRHNRWQTALLTQEGEQNDVGLLCLV